ncbi:MAG: YqhA family protein, partial [Burkholderiales bacterium]
SWMGTVDFSGLKIKLIGSIVAISGVHLLKQFMNMEAVNKEDLKWLLLTHAAFVTSGVLLALMDYFASKTKVK